MEGIETAKRVLRKACWCDSVVMPGGECEACKSISHIDKLEAEKAELEERLRPKTATEIIAAWEAANGPTIQDFIRNKEAATARRCAEIARLVADCKDNWAEEIAKAIENEFKEAKE